MNIGDLEPMAQCEILRLSHNYADKQRDELKCNGRKPKNEKEWCGDRIREATEYLVNLYK